MLKFKIFDDWKGKLVAFLVGIFTVFLLVEISVRVLWFVQKRPLPSQEEISQASGKNKTYTVLCLGNSHTKGYGVRPAEAFPAVLERMLKQKFPTKSIKVINRGIKNLNTRMMLRNLPRDIKITKPNLIILRTGSPNEWSNWGMGDYLEETGRHPSLWSRMSYKIRDSLENIKTFKFIDLLIFHSDKFREKGGIETDKKDWYKKNPFLRKYGYEVDLVYPVPKKLHQQHVIDNLEKNLVSYNPPNTSEREMQLNMFRHWYLGNIYRTMGADWKAAEIYYKGIVSHPDFPPGNKGYDYINDVNYNALLDLFQKYKYDYRNETNMFINQALINIEDKFSTGSKLNEDQRLAWTKYDIQKIIKFIKDKGIKLIFHNYPKAPHKDKLNSLLRKIAQEEKLPFIDNEAIFDKIFEKTKKEFYFSVRNQDHTGKYDQLEMQMKSYVAKKHLVEPDRINHNHLNSDGHKITAQQIFNTILIRPEILEEIYHQ